MIEVSKLLLLVLGELFLVSVVVVFVVVFLAISKRQRDRSAIQKLVARIKEDGGRREQETRKIMEERYGFAGNDLEELVKKIAREEKAFYQVLIDVYLKRNTEALQNLSVDYEGSVDTYRTLEIPHRGAVAAGSDDESVDSEELMMLKDENQRLTEELQVTMDTMGRMLSEYSLMFSGGADTDLDKAKMREMLSPGAAVSDDASIEEMDLGDIPDVDSADSPETTANDTASDPELEADEGLKALDAELAMLDLSEEEHSGAPGLDETLVMPADQTDEVVDLDDVLDDPEQK